MPTTTDRLDLRLRAADKRRICRAAELSNVPVAAFVRNAALREAETVIAQGARDKAAPLSARLRGRATARLSTDEIMQLTRGA